MNNKCHNIDDNIVLPILQYWKILFDIDYRGTITIYDILSNPGTHTLCSQCWSHSPTVINRSLSLGSVHVGPALFQQSLHYTTPLLINLAITTNSITVRNTCPVMDLPQRYVILESGSHRIKFLWNFKDKCFTTGIHFLLLINCLRTLVWCSQGVTVFPTNWLTDIE